MVKRATLAASRNVPWAPTINLRYSGAALPEITSVAMQVRQYAGASGDPLVDLTDITFSDEASTEAEIAAGRAARVLRLYPEVDVADWPDPDITGLNEPEAGEADVFFFDIIITYADSAVDRPVAGSFLLEPGVTV